MSGPTTPPDTGPTAWTPPPPPSPPPPKSRLSKGTGIVIVVVVVIALVLAALFLTGVIPGFKSSPSSGPSPPKYTVTFSESGLPSGTSWSVTLSGSTQSSTTATIAFSEANGTYSYSVGAVSGYSVSPSTGSVTVDGAAQSETVTFSSLVPGTYSVTFTETGLPSGTSWTVTLAGSPMSSTTTTITFSEKNGTYPYSVGSVTGYTVSPSSGNATVDGSAVAVTVTFTKSTELTGPAYAVTFAQTGLPATDLWDVYCVPELGSTILPFGVTNTGPSTEFAIPGATYFWHVGTGVSGYVAVPSDGNLTVSAPVTVTVKFLPLYAVNFTETGLTPGAVWTVTLNGTASSSSAPTNNTFEVPNGTYPFTVSAFGYTAAPASGTLTVSGVQVNKSITFTALPVYTVTFTESGLALGTVWSATLNGSYNVSVAPGNITFSFPNGMYPYTVLASGYTASPASGNVTVASAAKTVPITFTAITTYDVTFTETGLASGTVWSATLDGSPGSAVAPASIVIKAPNGVDPFDVYASGYTASPASGNVTVASSAKTVPITFTAIPPIPTYTVMFNESGLPPSSDWEVYMQNDGALISAAYSCSNASIAGTAMNCSLPNGYYSWVVYTYTLNYTASPMAGYLTVHDAAASVNVTYVNTSAEYLVSFSEYWYSLEGTGGLPNGTSWSVTLGGVTQSTEGMWVYFLEPNGTTKSYTITPPTGYVVLPSSGSLTGYSNAYQAAEFVTVSPSVLVVFVASDPPGGAPAAASVGSGVGIGLSGALVAPTRDS